MDSLSNDDSDTVKVGDWLKESGNVESGKNV
jgi:hypothetical protein